MSTPMYFWLTSKINNLPAGMAVNITSSDMKDAAEIFTTSNIFDSVRSTDITALIKKLEVEFDITITKLGYGNDFKIFKPTQRKINHDR